MYTSTRGPDELVIKPPITNEWGSWTLPYQLDQGQAQIMKWDTNPHFLCSEKRERFNFLHISCDAARLQSREQHIRSISIPVETEAETLFTTQSQCLRFLILYDMSLLLLYFYMLPHIRTRWCVWRQQITVNISTKCICCCKWCHFRETELKSHWVETTGSLK